MTTQGKNWCFTINNYTLDHEVSLKSIDSVYLIYGREVAPSTGTPHLQGFIVFATNKRFKAVLKLLPQGTHLAKANGNAQQNITYCSKEGDYESHGIPPVTPTDKGLKEKDRWANAFVSAQNQRIEEIPGDIQLRFYRTLKEIKKDYMVKPDPAPGYTGIWIYGESGVGKTHSVVTTYPDRYIKPLNKWWDGYQYEPVVHLDEVCPDHVRFLTPYLKKWGDRWPFDGETKGSALQVRPQKVIVTSNYAIDEMGFDHHDLPAIKNRYKEIKKEDKQQIILW